MLYTDDDEMIFDSQRPVILNGIEDVVRRSDLLDRSLVLYLPRIPEERRRSERDFWHAFTMQAPGILGALLDAAAAGLRKLADVQLSELPRMADFAKWAVACEEALGLTPGAFIDAYSGNRKANIDFAIESDPVASVVRKYIDLHPDGATATSTEWLVRLGALYGDQRPPKGWPQTPRGMGGALRRAAPDLRAVGIEVTYGRTSAAREIAIRPIAGVSPSSRSSP
jgi:hypothetical protein